MDISDPADPWFASLFVAQLTAKSGSSPILYTWVEQQYNASTGTYSTIEPARRGTAAQEINNIDVVVTGLPLVWMRTKGIVNGALAYEFKAPASSGVIRGKLDGALNFSSSATMSVWYYNGSAEADTNTNVTVYDWLLSTGQSISTNTQVTAAWDATSGRYYVIGAQCP